MPALPKPTKPVPIPDYIEWLHTQPCIVTGWRPVEAHHLTSLGHGRITRNDQWAVPLISELHNFGPQSVHVIGWSWFQLLHDVDLVVEAERCFAKWESQR